MKVTDIEKGRFYQRTSVIIPQYVGREGYINYEEMIGFYKSSRGMIGIDLMTGMELHFDHSLTACNDYIIKNRHKVNGWRFNNEKMIHCLSVLYSLNPDELKTYTPFQIQLKMCSALRDLNLKGETNDDKR